MNIDDVGTGPAVVLLQGAPSSADCFVPLVAALSPAWRVLVPEFPGYGATPAREVSTREGVAELAASLVARGVREAAVIGFSLGAYRALLLALDGRIRVRALFLLGGFASLTQAHREGMRAMAQMVAGLPDFQAPALRAQMVATMLSPAFAARPEARAAVEGWFDATTPAALALELRAAVEGEDLRPRLREIDAPLMARVGALDLAAPPAYSEELAEGALAGQLQLVPERGHALLIEDGPATIAAIEDFLARTFRAIA